MNDDIIISPWHWNLRIGRVVSMVWELDFMNDDIIISPWHWNLGIGTVVSMV